MLLLIVHISQAYTNIELTSECKIRSLEFNVKFLTFQIGLSLVNEAVVWAILERISFVEPLSSNMKPAYLKVSNDFYLIISPCNEVLLLKCLSQFVMIFVLFELISMPLVLEVESILFRLTSSCSNLRFVITLLPIYTVPLWSSRASLIICSSIILNNVGDNRHIWRTPVLVVNHLFTFIGYCAYCFFV